MADLYKNLINGEWKESHTGKTFERRNPATDEVVCTYTSSDAKDVDEAVAAAAKAFKSWRLYLAPKRGEILYRAAQILEQRKDVLALQMPEDIRKAID